MRKTFATTQTAKILVLSAIALCMPLQANAQSDEVNQCRVIQDTAKRIICYDNLYGRINPSSGEIETGAPDEPLDDIDKRVQALMAKSKGNNDPFSSSRPRLDGNPVSSRKQADGGFGSSKQSDQGSVDDDSISLSIASFKEDYRGLQTFTMSNGQVWRQTESILFIVNEGDSVVIEKGMLGSFYMKKTDANGRVRVKRVD